MPVKKAVIKKSTAKRLPSTAKKAEVGKRKSESLLSVPVYSLTGRAAGTLDLPKEIFGQKVNKSLLSQTVRVYSTNEKTLTGFTKTRGEVVGSTAKIFRQKGTGRARHGAIRAPIFVGGGIAFGPKPRKVRLDLPKKMKKAALISALSSKVVDTKVIGLSGVEKASGKTKEMFQLLNAVTEKGKNSKSALIVTDKKIDSVARSVRNIPGVSVLSANMINAYEVLRHDLLLITKEAVEELSKESRVKSLESSKKAEEPEEKKGKKS